MSVGGIGSVDLSALFDVASTQDGVVGMAYTDPMDASTLAVAVVPELTVTMIGDAGGGGSALLVVRQYGTAVALIELGDGYLLDIDRARASVLLSNPLTGLHTTIWGDDAAMALSDDGETARFWGNVTFALDNGAVITAATARREDNPMVYQLDTLTVTKRSAAVIVADIAAALADPDTDAALTVTTARKGQAVEHRTPDGLVLEQDAEQDGWVREDTQIAADLAWLAQTAPGASHGPEADPMSGREFGRFIGDLVAGLSRYSVIHAIPPSLSVAEASRPDPGRRAEDGIDRAIERRRIYLDSLRPRTSSFSARPTARLDHGYGFTASARP